MFIEKNKKVMAFILTLALVVGVFVMPAAEGFGAGPDVTNLLINNPNTDYELTVKQNGVVIGSTDVIQFGEPIDISVKIRVPVLGDGDMDDKAGVDKDDPNTYVAKGSEAKIEIAKGFKLDENNTAVLSHFSNRLGELKLKTEGAGENQKVVAEINFDGDDIVFDYVDGVTRYDVYVEFNARLEYVGSSQEDNAKTEEISILEKTYTVDIPELPVEFHGKKSGTVNGRTIEWVVEVEAKKEETGTPIALDDYTFFDDLKNVGDYIDDSFKIGSDDDIANATSPISGVIYTTTNGERNLQYTFPSGTGSGKKFIFFTTKIDDSKLKDTDKTVTITNKAKIKEVGIEKASFEDSVSFDVDLFKKVGAITSFDKMSGKGTIEWSIIVDPWGATLHNAQIKDVLPEGLTYKSSYYQTWDGSDWVGNEVIIPVSGNFGTEVIDTASIYSFSEINKKIKLTIVTEIESNDIGHTIKKIENQAFIRWVDTSGGAFGGIDGSGEMGSNKHGVEIGFNPISKAVGTYDAAKHTIPWTVTVENSNISVDLYVMDLFVYGTALNQNDIASLAIKEKTSNVDGNLGMYVHVDVGDAEKVKANISNSKLTKNLNQRYVAGSFESLQPLDLGYIVYTLNDSGGNAFADLLVVTMDDGTGLDVSSKNVNFGFKTKVTNPNFYAGNGSKNVKNTAELFSAGERINNDHASVGVDGKMLSKENVGGFDYINGTITYNLFINKNEIDFTNDGTTIVDGQKVGKITLTDQLPEGWGFIKINDNDWFSMYEGVDTSGVAMDQISIDEVIDESIFINSNASTAEFTFKKLEKAYVIQIKAKASPEKFDEYFKTNATTPMKNIAKLSAENWQPGLETFRTVNIKSEIFNKGFKQDKNGVLKWTVEYKPYGVDRTGAEITDILPMGLDLRTDSNGNLLIADDNIEVYELELKTNGSYEVKKKLTQAEFQDYISYTAGDRTLKFEIPEKDKAYRLVYITDVTGFPGEKLTNTAKLSAGTEIDSDLAKEYAVSEEDAKATMKTIGFIEITKLDGANSATISDVEFELFNEDESIVLRSGKTDINGKLQLKGLVEGTYYLKEVINPMYDELGIEYKVVVGKDSTDNFTVNINQTGSNKVTILNYEAGTVSNLDVMKIISGNAADINKEFEFTISMPDMIGKSTFYEGSGGKTDSAISFDLNGEANFTLKGGQGIKIKNLPIDKPYSITENDYSHEGYTTTKTDDTGVIVSGTDVLVKFTNHKSSPAGPKYGNLTISKTVVGTGGDKDREFAFQFRFPSDKTTSFSYTGFGMPNGTIKHGELFNLKHGQNITINNLPAGGDYAIAEGDYSDLGYLASAKGASGTIFEGETAHAQFTNRNDKADTGKPGKDPDDETGILGEEDEDGSIDFDDDNDTDESGILGGDDSRFPKTGDDFPMAIWISILAISILGLVILRRKIKEI